MDDESLAALVEIAIAATDYADDTDCCHFCEGGKAHHAECPVGRCLAALGREVLANARRAGVKP